MLLEGKVGIKENNRDETASNNKTYILNPLPYLVDKSLCEIGLVGGGINKAGTCVHDQSLSLL